MRILAIRVGIIDRNHVGPLQAAADDAPQPGRWLSANLGLGTIVSVLSLLITLVGGYVSLRSSQQSDIVELREHDAAKDRQIGDLRKAIDENKEEANRRFLALGARFQAEVVGRPEYQDNNKAIETRLDALQTWQLQVNGHLIQGAR